MGDEQKTQKPMTEKEWVSRGTRMDRALLVRTERSFVYVLIRDLASALVR